MNNTMNTCILFIWTDQLLTFLALLTLSKSPDQLFCRIRLDLAVAVSSWAESGGRLVSYSGEAGPLRASHQMNARVRGARDPPGEGERGRRKRRLEAQR